MGPTDDSRRHERVDLERFVRERRQQRRALEEVTNGEKQTHWMWFVFPQVAGLGSSGMSRGYAITSVEEAQAFLAHPVLGADYIEIVSAVREQVVDHELTLLDLFGKPDNRKLVSSVTLFERIARRHRTDLRRFIVDAESILTVANAEGLPRCPFTQRFLREGGIDPD